jgi:hypothetical protein
MDSCAEKRHAPPDPVPLSLHSGLGPSVHKLANWAQARGSRPNRLSAPTTPLAPDLRLPHAPHPLLPQTLKTSLPAGPLEI